MQKFAVESPALTLCAAADRRPCSNRYTCVSRI